MITEEELKAVCKEVFTKWIVIAPKEAVYIEKSTRLQAQSLLQFEHRMDCTASMLLADKCAPLTLHLHPL